MLVTRGKILDKQIKKNRALGPVVEAFERKVVDMTREMLRGGGFQLEKVRHDESIWTIRIAAGDRAACGFIPSPTGEVLFLIEAGTHSEIYKKYGSEADLMVDAMSLIPKKAMDPSWYVPIATFLAVVFSIGLLDALNKQDDDWTEEEAERILSGLNDPTKLDRMLQILGEFNQGAQIAPGSKEHRAAQILAKVELVEEGDGLWHLTSLGQTLFYKLSTPQSVSGARQILEGEIV